LEGNFSINRLQILMRVESAKNKNYRKWNETVYYFFHNSSHQRDSANTLFALYTYTNVKIIDTSSSSNFDL